MTKLSAYGLILDFYMGKAAKRSGVPYMNHIIEGMKILDVYEAAPNVVEAFCLHPMFQEDKDFVANFHLIHKLDPELIALVIEYRATANFCLSGQIKEVEYHRGCFDLEWKRKPKLSPLFEVNQMLIADKVQNRKDFELYHLGTHPRSKQLDFYFRSWLEVLGVSEERYQELKEMIS